MSKSLFHVPHTVRMSFNEPHTIAVTCVPDPLLSAAIAAKSLMCDKIDSNLKIDPFCRLLARPRGSRFFASVSSSSGLCTSREIASLSPSSARKRSKAFEMRWSWMGESDLDPLDRSKELNLHTHLFCEGPAAIVVICFRTCGEATVRKRYRNSGGDQDELLRNERR